MEKNIRPKKFFIPKDKLDQNSIDSKKLVPFNKDARIFPGDYYQYTIILAEHKKCSWQKMHDIISKNYKRRLSEQNMGFKIMGRYDLNLMRERRFKSKHEKSKEDGLEENWDGYEFIDNLMNYKEHKFKFINRKLIAVVDARDSDDAGPVEKKEEIFDENRKDDSDDQDILKQYSTEDELSTSTQSLDQLHNEDTDMNNTNNNNIGDCQLCCKPNDIFKKLVDCTEHKDCLMWCSNQISMKNKEYLQVIFGEMKKKRCCFCMQFGAAVMCNKRRCNECAHLHCIMLKAQQPISNINIERSVFNCNNHK